MNMQKKETKPESSRGYIIALSKWRSRMALLASLITVSFSLYGIAGSIVAYVEAGLTAGELFHWFTINSNFLTALSACMIIPFAVEGIRKKHFSYPKWVAMIHYSGMVCTTLITVFSSLFMSWVDPYAAFGGYNLYLHIFCPVMVLVSFFQVESGFHYTWKDACLASAPAFLYEAVYYCEVVLIGKENGGWADMYRIGEFVPMEVGALGVTLLALGISFLIRWLNNRLALARHQRMAARLWPKDVNPVEINIEIFGLGRYMGKHADAKFIELPLDLIHMIAEQYHLKTEDLIRPYIRGFLDSLAEKRKQ